MKKVTLIPLVIYILILKSTGLHISSTQKLRYTYETEAVLNEADIHPEDKIYRMNSDVGMKVGTIFELSSRWTNPSNSLDQIIEAEFLDFEIYNVSNRLKKDNSFLSKKRKDSLRSLKKPLVYRITDGLVTELYVNGEETVTSLNIKRGILSLFQLLHESGQRNEEDPSGLCPVNYEVKESTIEKQKDITKCVNHEEKYTALNEVIGVYLNSTSRVVYELSEDSSHILYAAGIETHVLRVNIKKDSSLFIVGRQKLGLLEAGTRSAHYAYTTKDDALKAFAKEMRKNGNVYVRQSLITDPETKACADGCLDFRSVVDAEHDSLAKENMANISSAEAFISAVRAARQSSEKVLDEVVNNEDNKDIRLTLIDILAAAQTEAALKVLIAALDFSKKTNTGDIERGLTGISFSSHPTLSALEALAKVFEGEIASDKIRDTVALSLGAILNKLCQASEENCKSEPAKKVKQLIREGLESCGEEEAAQTLYIQFVRNSARPEFIPHLVDFAEHSKHPLVHHQAIKSLLVYPAKLMDENVMQVMNRIYHQNLKSYETTVRSAAANLILSTSPEERDVKNILLSLPEQKSKEISMFLIERIRDLIKTNHPSSYVIKKVMKDMKYANYYTVAQNGMASAYTGYMYKSADSSGTYGLMMEYSNAGMMRRTAVDFSLATANEKISLTQLGIVAQGLEGLTGSVPDEGEEELDSMVGMASAMMGVKLRPLTFFRGYSDMMALVWGSSDDEGAGVEAMLMMMDFLQHIPLASGLRIKAEVIGAISVEISADIKFSLWHRNVEIVTTNGGALSIQCRMSLESPILRATVRSLLDAKSALEFSVFTDFKTLPPRSCMRLSYPSFVLTKSLRKFERVRSSARRMMAMRREKLKVRGTTLPLHKGNSQMCALIVGPQ